MFTLSALKLLPWRLIGVVLAIIAALSYSYMSGYKSADKKHLAAELKRTELQRAEHDRKTEENVLLGRAYQAQNERSTKARTDSIGADVERLRKLTDSAAMPALTNPGNDQTARAVESDTSATDRRRADEIAQALTLAYSQARAQLLICSDQQIEAGKQAN